MPRLLVGYSAVWSAPAWGGQPLACRRPGSGLSSPGLWLAGRWWGCRFGWWLGV